MVAALGLYLDKLAQFL